MENQANWYTELVAKKHLISNAVSGMYHLRDGWMDGEGVSFDPNFLEFLDDFFSIFVERGGGKVRLYPCLDGKVEANLELDNRAWDVTVEVDPVQLSEFRAMKLDAKNNNLADITVYVDLNHRQAVDELLDWVRFLEDK